MASWSGGSGACLPFFPLSSSFGVFVTLRSLDGELEGAFPLGCSFSQLWGCPASAVAVVGLRCRVWQARPFFGTVYLVPVQDSSLPLLCSPFVPTLRVCLPQAPALQQVLEAMLAEGALESPSTLILAFHSSLSLVEESSDGLAASVRYLSPGRLCLAHSICVEFSRLCAISLLRLAFLAPLGLTSGFCRIQWRCSSRKLLRFPCRWGLSVLSLDRVLWTSSLSSQGVLARGCYGSLSWASTSPVWSSGCFWLRGA